MNYRILVASYSDEIITLNFNSDSGSLSVINSVTVGHHPSWITPHESDTSVYFTALEQAAGVVIALKYNDSGKVEILNKVSSDGDDPCTLVMSKGDLLVGNVSYYAFFREPCLIITKYSSGTVVTIPLSSTHPYLLTKPTISNTCLELSGSGPDKGRQLAPHPHQTIIHPDGEEVRLTKSYLSVNKNLTRCQQLLVPDLGSDKTWRLVKCGNGSWENRGHIQYSAGSGPRHVAFYGTLVYTDFILKYSHSIPGDILYTLAELNSTVIAHRLPPLPAEPTFLKSVPTKAHPLPFPNEMLAAEILVANPNGSFPTPYLYVSNRNDPSPAGDTISIFSITDDTLKLITEVPTGLNHVRGIAFGGPDSKYLIAGGVIGHGVKIFERISEGKSLKEVASNAGVKAPTGFVWV